MPFKLIFAPEALKTLRELEDKEDAKDPLKLKKVRICLGRIEANPRYPGLQSHKYSDKKGKNGEDVWESYVENNSPSAWRVFWHYGPKARNHYPANHTASLEGSACFGQIVSEEGGSLRRRLETSAWSNL